MEIKLINLTKSFGAKQVIQPTSFMWSRTAGMIFRLWPTTV